MQTWLTVLLIIWLILGIVGLCLMVLPENYKNTEECQSNFFTWIFCILFGPIALCFACYGLSNKNKKKEETYNETKA